MKKGLNQWSVPVGTPIGDLVSMAASNGFDGVELLYREDGQLGPGVPLAKAREIARQAGDQGLDIIGFASGTLLNKYSLAHGSKEERARARDVVRHMFETAKALGAGSILCVPGRVDAENRYDQAYEKVCQFLPALVPYAKEYQVPVCLENVWNLFLLSPLEFRALIDQIGSEWIGAYFDVGNILPFGYPDQWIRILGERIRRIHVKDVRKGVAGIDAILAPGEGDVDWPAVMQALMDVGYDGYLTVEVPPRKHLPQTFVRALSIMLDGILGLQ